MRPGRPEIRVKGQRMGDGVVVDSHQHFWDPRMLPAGCFSPEQQVLNQAYLPDRLGHELEGAGVDCTVLVQGLPQTPENNAWLFSLAERTDFVAGVVAWADLTRPDDLSREIDLLQQHRKFCGVRHIAELEPDDWLVREEVLGSLRHLARRGIPYDFCVRPRHLRHVLRIAREIPDLRIVLDHIAKPDIAHREMAGWAGAVAELGRRPQAYCKVSGLITETDWKDSSIELLRPFVRHVLDVFGPDRLMFGSDWPVCLLAGDYREVWTVAGALLSDLSQAERQKVFGANAIRFYGLNCAGRSSKQRAHGDILTKRRQG